MHFCCLKPAICGHQCDSPRHSYTEGLIGTLPQMNWTLGSILCFLKFTAHHEPIGHIVIEHILRVRVSSGFQKYHSDQNTQNLLPSRSMSWCKETDTNKYIRSAQCPKSAQIKRQYEFNIPSGTFSSTQLQFIYWK